MRPLRIAIFVLVASLSVGVALPAEAQYVTKRSSTSYAVQGPTKTPSKTTRSQSATSEQRGQTLSTKPRNGNVQGNAQRNALGQTRTVPAQPQKR